MTRAVLAAAASILVGCGAGCLDCRDGGACACKPGSACGQYLQMSTDPRLPPYYAYVCQDLPKK